MKHEFLGVQRSSLFSLNLPIHVLIKIILIFGCVQMIIMGWLMAEMLVVSTEKYGNISMIIIGYGFVDFIFKLFSQSNPKGNILPYLSLPFSKYHLSIFFSTKLWLSIPNLLGICFWLAFSWIAYKSEIIMVLNILLLVSLIMSVNSFMLLHIKLALSSNKFSIWSVIITITLIMLALYFGFDQIDLVLNSYLLHFNLYIQFILHSLILVTIFFLLVLSFKNLMYYE